MPDAPNPSNVTAKVAETPTPGTAATPAPGQNLNNAFSSLESLYGGGDSPPSQPDAPAASAEKTSDQPPPSGKTAPEKPDTGVENVTGKPPETKSPDPKAPPPFERAGELRKQRDQTRLENEQLKAKLKQFESEIKAKTEDPERKAMESRIADYEKKVKDLDERLRFKAYEESDEYQAKYYKPFLDAYSTARAKIAALKVVERKDDMDNVVQQARQATPEDFDRIMQMRDDDSATELAERLFGAKAAAVIYHRERVQELNNTREHALEDFRKNGAEREAAQRKTFEESSKAIQKETNDYWQKHLREPIEKYPHLFKEIEGDEKGNELLRKGMDMAVMAFKNMNPMDQKLTSQEREQVIAAHAAVFNWATAGPRLAHQNKTLKAEIAQLKKDLESYEKTESPGASDGAGRTAKPGQDRVTMDSVLDGLNKFVTPINR